MPKQIIATSDPGTMPEIIRVSYFWWDGEIIVPGMKVADSCDEYEIVAVGQHVSYKEYACVVRSLGTRKYFWSRMKLLKVLES